MVGFYNDSRPMELVMVSMVLDMLVGEIRIEIESKVEFTVQ